MNNTFFIGQSHATTTLVTAEMINRFADVSGDKNPIHIDADFAAKTVFKQRIAHGMLISSFISATLANHLPGNGCIYLGQELKFLKPVFINDSITVTVTIQEIKIEKNILTLETICTNQQGENVIVGRAVLKVQ